MKWTYEKCKEVALKYNAKVEFRNKETSAYNKAYKNKWLDEICSHMNIKNKPPNYWTYETCKKVSLLCKTKDEFIKQYPVAYNTSLKSGFYDEITQHLSFKKNKSNYWNEEKCKEASSTCRTKNEFVKKYKSAYNSAVKLGIIDKICSHMEIFDLNKRLIYVCEFSDNSVYVGLTCDSFRRKEEHFNTDTKSSVYKHILETGLIPEYKELTSYLDASEAIKMEYYYLNYYENLGYMILNKAKPGGLGGREVKWNYETCKEEAKKYNNRGEFSKNKPHSYSISLKNGWLDEFMPKKSKIYWTKERCIEIAKTCKTKMEFRNHKGCYYSASINKWLEEIYKIIGF
jgi:predicted GIY-YIG superfamily endonuclease